MYARVTNIRFPPSHLLLYRADEHAVELPSRAARPENLRSEREDVSSQPPHDGAVDPRGLSFAPQYKRGFIHYTLLFRLAIRGALGTRHQSLMYTQALWRNTALEGQSS